MITNFQKLSDGPEIFSKLSHTEIRTLHMIGAEIQKLREVILHLHHTRQFHIRSMVLERIRIQLDVDLCRKLFILATHKHCQQVVLNDCQLCAGPELEKMEQLCQFTMQRSELKMNNAMGDAVLDKFSNDLRYKPKRSLPFYVSSDNLSPRSICKFLKNWVHISESAFFEIRVEECGEDFQAKFLNECARIGLAQIHMEFPSLAHPTAHVKAKFNKVGPSIFTMGAYAYKSFRMPTAS